MRVSVASQKKRVLSRLSLGPCYPKPPPMWYERAFIGEFGDAYVEGTGLEGGSTGTSALCLGLGVLPLSICAADPCVSIVPRVQLCLCRCCG